MLRNVGLQIEEAASDERQYKADPLEYIAKRLECDPTILLPKKRSSLGILLGTLARFLEDDQLPAEYSEEFKRRIVQFCTQQEPTACATYFIMLDLMAGEHHLLAEARRLLQDRNRWGMLAAAAERITGASQSLDGQAGSDRQQVPFIPSTMRPGPYPIIVGRREAARNQTVTDLVDKGNELANEGRERQAIEHFDKALQILPDHFQANLGKAQMLLATGDARGSLPILEKLHRMRPNSATVQSLRGSVLIKLDRLNEALSAIDDALRLDPDRLIASLNRASVLRSVGQPLEAADILLGIADSKFSQAQAHGAANNMIRLATELLNTDDDKAMSLLTKARHIAPSRLESYRLMARILNGRGEHQRAADAILDGFIATREAQILREALTAAGRLPPSSRLLKVVQAHLTQIPNDGRTWNDYGVYLMRVCEDHSGALHCFETAVRLEPSHAKHWLNLGAATAEAATSSAQLTDAVSSLSRSLSIEPRSVDALYNRAICHIRLGDIENAIVDLETAQILNPQFANVSEILSNLRASR